MKLYKGVFKGGGGRVQPPPKKNSDLFLKVKEKRQKEKTEKRKGM